MRNIHITADEGLYYGLGAFETIAVENGTPIFAEDHLERLARTACALDFPFDVTHAATLITNAIACETQVNERWCVKLVATPSNMFTSTRPNTYTAAMYARGFTCTVSSVRRNETSALVRYKTLNYGDCIVEKRRAHKAGCDEPLFLNTQGMLAEGATTNVFLVTGGRIVTPDVTSGILPGILRTWIIQNYDVEERTVSVEELWSADEAFVTNSLLGVMPIVRIDHVALPGRSLADQLSRTYFDTVCKPHQF